MRCSKRTVFVMLFGTGTKEAGDGVGFKAIIQGNPLHLIHYLLVPSEMVYPDALQRYTLMRNTRRRSRIHPPMEQVWCGKIPRHVSVASRAFMV